MNNKQIREFINLCKDESKHGLILTDERKLVNDIVVNILKVSHLEEIKLLKSEMIDAEKTIIEGLKSANIGLVLGYHGSNPIVLGYLCILAESYNRTLKANKQIVVICKRFKAFEISQLILSSYNVLK